MIVIYDDDIIIQAEKARARTKEEEVIAHERAKAKEAKAKMELHDAKAKHAAEKLSTKQAHYYGTQQPHVEYYEGNQPFGSIPKPGTTAPTYPLGGKNILRNNHI